MFCLCPPTQLPIPFWYWHSAFPLKAHFSLIRSLVWSEHRNQPWTIRILSLLGYSDWLINGYIPQADPVYYPAISSYHFCEPPPLSTLSFQCVFKDQL